MKLKMFVMFDSKVGSYYAPMFYRSKGEALREMADILEKDGHPWSKHPEDYILFEIGEYDDQSATFEPTTPVSLGVLVEFKKLV